MASVSGENIEVGRHEWDFGVRVEAYLNRCEGHSAEAGHEVYHGIVEIIDARGGIEVSVSVIPVVNMDGEGSDGHWHDAEAAKVQVEDSMRQLIDGINKQGEGHDPAEIIKSMYYADAMQSQRDSLMAMLSSMADEDKPTEDGNPFAGLFGG